MSRVGLSVVVAAVVGVSLTGCSSALSSNSSSEQLQALKFESDPLGAEIRTTQGQTRRKNNSDQSKLFTRRISALSCTQFAVTI